MKAGEFRKKSRDELSALFRELMLRREELTIGLKQKKIKNVKELRQVRKDLARILTILQQVKQVK